MIFQNTIPEKRAHSRFSVRLPVQYRPLSNVPAEEKFKGKVALAKDLSLEGLQMKIAPDKEMRSGEVLRIEITLPELSKHLFAFAEVIWVNRIEAGIHLMLMPEEDRQILKSYLDQIVFA